MKKLLTTLALTGVLASTMLAEIESSVDSSKEWGFCQGKHSNTGCFVGLSVGFSPATTKVDFDDSSVKSNPKKREL